MADLEKVINGLACIAGEVVWCAQCQYSDVNGSGRGDRCKRDCAKDALALLKAKQSRVMTLEDIRVIYHRREDHVWPFDTPPYLWVETNGRTVPYWISWNNVVACLEGQYPKYDPDDYGKTWRCWTSSPDEKVRAETPWET